MSIAVVICLDRNKLVEQEVGPPITIFYEMEAVRCIKAWRQFAGWDGKIYAIQYEGRTVSRKTNENLLAHGVCVRTLRYDLPRKSFMDVVQALAWAEQNIAEDRIIYSDLDICMKKPLPLEFTEQGQTVLYHYTQENQRRSSKEFEYRLRRGKELGYFCHNTYFQAFDRKYGFQAMALAVSLSEEYNRFFTENIYYKPTDDDYFFEEGIYDFICMNYAERFNILDLPCSGENNLFRHEHITAETMRI